MHKYYDQFETCREHDIPFCSDACPFHLDFLDIQQKLTQNKYNTAYKTLRNALVFPEIVAALCPAYCETACVRKEIDEPIHINLLEKTILAKATRKKPNEYNVPAKKGKIAVVGSGISGMGFAFRLASKKYQVTVYEKGPQIGGHLKELLPEDIYLEDFQRQFQFEEYTLHLNSEITDLQELIQQQYDVVYLATGAGGSDFGILKEANDQTPCSLMGDTAVFAGGSLCGKETIPALADGINIARSAEIFLKTRSLEYPVPEPASRAVANRQLLIQTPAAAPSDSDGTFTDQETVDEVSRCIRCQCNACQTHCDLVAYFEKWPRSMRDEIIITSKPSKSLIHKNPAMRYINACTQCDLFQQVCPSDINLCDMIKHARYKIHTLEKTPGAFRQYFLREMAFANGPFAAIKKPAPGKDQSAFAFFPGCSLGALNPDYVYRSYQWLLSINPDTGLLLRCCSVPVDWNGEEDLHLEEIQKLKKDWQDLGQPTLITACMTCQKHLAQYLPEIPTISLYQQMAQENFRPQNRLASKTFSVFDPCAARGHEAVQEAVRSLAEGAGLCLEDLPEKDRHGCCGFGGMGEIAAPDFTDYVVKKRGELSNNPYLVYCSNCRDVFTDRGKEAVHLLDILLDVDPENQLAQPTATQRRENRVILKERLLKELWGEEMKSKPEKSQYRLILSDAIREKANRLKLLEEDICSVIDHAQQTGRRTYDPETDHYKAYHEIGYITCWVEYGIGDGEYEIFNVYTHRMKIELEAVFNGKKIDL